MKSGKIRAVLSRAKKTAPWVMAAIGLFSVGFAFLDEHWWFADLFSHPRPQYCLWLAVAFVWALLARQRGACWIALAGLLINAGALAPYAMPWRNDLPAGQTPSAQPWTILSINLLQGNQEVSSVVAYVREVNPDVVVFQEVTPRLHAALEELRDLFPHRHAEPRTHQFGLSIFSRHPMSVEPRIVGSRPLDLALLARFESPKLRLSLACVHPDKPDARWKIAHRESYLTQIAQWSRERTQSGDAVVVLGDFNATPWSASMRAFTRESGLLNTSQGDIFGATWNVWHPQQLQLDQAFLSPGWTLHERKIGPAIGSDHRPLWIRATPPTAR